jgi:hypothetical protein
MFSWLACVLLRIGAKGKEKRMYQPKTGEPCHCRRGMERDNCPDCEGTGQRIDFRAIREALGQPTFTLSNQGLQIAARLGAIETVTLVDGYDRNKSPRTITFRRFTMDDIKAINYGSYWFESNDGKARQCRVASRLKTWIRDPNRFECSFKYGLYESFRMDTENMLSRLLVEV